MSKPGSSKSKSRGRFTKASHKQLSKGGKGSIKVMVKNMDARDMLIRSNRQSIDDARQVIRKHTVEKVGDLRGVLKPKKATAVNRRGGGDLRIALGNRKPANNSTRAHETPRLVYATENKRQPRNPTHNPNARRDAMRLDAMRPDAMRSAGGDDMQPLMRIINDTVQPTGIPAHMRRQPQAPAPQRPQPAPTRSTARSYYPPSQTRQAAPPSNMSSSRSPFNSVAVPAYRRQPHYAAAQPPLTVYSRPRSRSPLERGYNEPVRCPPSPPRYSLPRRRSPSPPPVWRPPPQSPPKYASRPATYMARPDPFLAAHHAMPEGVSRMRMDHMPVAAALAADRNLSSQRSMTQNGHSAGRGGQAATLPTGFVLKVSSLSRDVTEGDVEELFGDVGPLRYTKLHSPGSAEVCYHSQADAFAAIDKYDRRELDGIPMDIRLVTPMARSNRNF